MAKPCKKRGVLNHGILESENSKKKKKWNLTWHIIVEGECSHCYHVGELKLCFAQWHRVEIIAFSLTNINKNLI